MGFRGLGRVGWGGEEGGLCLCLFLYCTVLYINTRYT